MRHCERPNVFASRRHYLTLIQVLAQVIIKNSALLGNILTLIIEHKIGALRCWVSRHFPSFLDYVLFSQPVPSFFIYLYK